jgi:hypothetical protein
MRDGLEGSRCSQGGCERWTVPRQYGAHSREAFPTSPIPWSSTTPDSSALATIRAFSTPPGSTGLEET